MLGWQKPIGKEFIAFWFQCSQDGWDDFAGSKFIVEFQISKLPELYSGRLRRRLPRFLKEEELEQVRTMQNRVISKLSKPDRSHYIFEASEEVVAWYLQRFERIERPYRNSEDIWLRYKDESDAKMWATFVLEVLPRALDDLMKENDRERAE
jgi:hypothetical protein